jgi:hypothetical protein
VRPAPCSSPQIEIPGGFYLSRIQLSDKPAYLKHFVEPEIAANTLIPFPYTDADAEAWLDQCEKTACDPEKNFAIRESAGHLIGGIAITKEAHYLTRPSSVTGWRNHFGAVGS